jgi:hypothetical protein
MSGHGRSPASRRVPRRVGALPSHHEAGQGEFAGFESTPAEHGAITRRSSASRAAGRRVCVITIVRAGCQIKPIVFHEFPDRKRGVCYSAAQGWRRLSSGRCFDSLARRTPPERISHSSPRPVPISLVTTQGLPLKPIALASDPRRPAPFHSLRCRPAPSPRMNPEWSGGKPASRAAPAFRREGSGM